MHAGYSMEQQQLSRTGIGCLSVPLLAEILQHLPLQQRMTQAALVGPTWAAAASMATVIVDVRVPTTRLPALQLWLQRNARQLQRVRIERHMFEGPAGELQLPCAELLQLSYLSVSRHSLLVQQHAEQGPTDGDDTTTSTAVTAAAGGGGRGGSLQLLPKLKAFLLTDCILSSASSLAALSAATALTELQLKSIRLPGYDEQSIMQLQSAILSLLQHLTQLEWVRLENLSLNDAVLSKLSCLQRLRSFDLQATHPVTGLTRHCLADLPSSVTCLSVSEDGGGERLYVLPPALPHLHNLHTLFLTSAKVPAVLLQSLPELRVLHIEECALLHYNELVGAYHYDNYAAATQDLLSALTTLTKLEDLTIMRLYNWDSWYVPPEAFAALTASTLLKDFSIVAEDGSPLPIGAIDHMFPTGKRLPAIKSFALEADGMGDPDMAYNWCLTSADLHKIALACPAVQWVHLDCVLEPGDVTPLLQLRSCSRMTVGGVAFSDAAVAVVTQLTQLTNLEWKTAPGLTDVGLQQLTALGQLEVLELLENLDISREVVPSNWFDALELQLRPSAQVGVLGCWCVLGGGGLLGGGGWGQ